MLIRFATHSTVVGLFLLLTNSYLFAQEMPEPVTVIEDQEELVERLGNRSEAIFHDNDRLTFLYRSDAAKVGIQTMVNASLKRIGRTDTYIGQLIVPDSERLIMSYAFKENDEETWHKLAPYRGPDAPAIPQSRKKLRGKHYKYRLRSEHLDCDRGLEVYVPKTDSDQPLPVVYLTDGQALGDVAGALDWKIATGKIAPLILVGIHNGGYLGNRDLQFNTELDYRALEYLSGIGSERYDAHKRFVAEEVMPFVEQHHPASTEREKRALSGYSNGGAYAVTAGTEQAGTFGHVFAYSVAFFVDDTLKNAANSGQLPQYRLAAGTLESFIRGTQRAEKILMAAGADVVANYHVAGHDPLLWKIALLDDLQAVFPGEKSADQDR